jgi:hypothetical protein
MMSLEQRMRELVAAARNTQQRQEITLSRGLKVVAQVNPETDRLELLTYRELPPRIDEQTQAKIPRSSRTEAEVVTRAAGGTWNSPHNLETVKWMPWQIVEQSPEGLAAILLERQRLAKLENEKRKANTRVNLIEKLVQIMLAWFKPHRDNVEIYGDLWREGLEQRNQSDLERFAKIPDPREWDEERLVRK